MPHNLGFEELAGVMDAIGCGVGWYGDKAGEASRNRDPRHSGGYQWHGRGNSLCPLGGE